MPHLTWASKTPPAPLPAALELDSLVYPQGTGYPNGEPQDTLVLGDNLAAMSALLPEWERRIHLIYADPPFFTNRRYPARVGRGEDSRRPQDWQLAEGYPDHWPDIDAYLDMLYPRLYLMHRLLAPTGTLYLHLDWHANHYARLLLDEIFGPERLLNEIVWVYHGPSPIRRAFNRKHDIILAYTKGKEYTFNVDAVRQPYDPNTIKTFESSTKAGFGKVPDLERGKVPEDWWYFPVVARLHRERTGYPTQKPEALLERIILASSNPGEIVADFFCGSGTTPVVAQRLGRCFLASDSTSRAVHTTRCRLVAQAGKCFGIKTAIERRLIADKTAAEEEGWKTKELSLGPASFVLDPSEKTLAVAPELLPSLDYWEVDPAYDGKVFRSIAQAWRPRGKESLPGELRLPGNPGEGPLCVRLVGIDGSRAEVVLPGSEG